jgi:hypothetical protein
VSRHLPLLWSSFNQVWPSAWGAGAEPPAPINADHVAALAASWAERHPDHTIRRYRCVCGGGGLSFACD